MRGKYSNRQQQDSVDSRIWSITTEPKFGIGQRCFLLETPEGNILWDLICYLDDETIAWIRSRGGIKAIVISHPHYYTTHLHWAEVFDCPVYLAAADQEWLSQVDQADRRRFIGERESIVPGVEAIQTGGHFPGSLVLHWEKKLFIADTFVTVPVSITPDSCRSGQKKAHRS
jgi:glyoxylase-like metal-dependent hydrolase (beta-lactamase superfamily II)